MYLIQNADGEFFGGSDYNGPTKGWTPRFVSAEPDSILCAMVLTGEDLKLVVNELVGRGEVVRCVRIPGKDSDVPLLPEPRVWQMPEGAKLEFSIWEDDIDVARYREPTVGQWYVGVNVSQTLKLYGATARYEGEGRWYLGTGARIDLYQYDYLQELA